MAFVFVCDERHGLLFAFFVCDENQPFPTAVCVCQVLEKHNEDNNDTIDRAELEAALKDVSMAVVEFSCEQTITVWNSSILI